MDYEVMIIGGGPAGYTAAIRASQLGGKVALVEPGPLGGTCLNWGCIPTKVYAHASELIDEIKSSDKFGIRAQYEVETDVLRAKKESVVKALVRGVGYLMKYNRIEVIQDTAEFVDTNTLKLTSGKHYTAKKIIIATGSKIFVPPIPGADASRVMDSQQALEMESIPESIAIIGGGVIGLEFASIYASLGSKVTVIEMLSELLPMLDRDVVKELMKGLKEKKIQVVTGSQVTAIKETDAGLSIVYQKEGIEEMVQCEKALMAVGRTPNVNGIESLNLEMSGKGIQVNEHMQTSQPDIYAIGDVTGGIQLAHYAAEQGIVAAHHAMGQEKGRDLSMVPSAIYMNPEVAWVGLNETQAKEQFGKVKTAVFPFAASGRAKTMGEKTGLVKVVTGGDYDQLLGMQMVGKNASELIQQGVLAIHNQLTIHEVIDTIHGHPTISEGIKEACEKIAGFPINMV
jgi:dihydrolipoamide dehydrogenase